MAAKERKDRKKQRKKEEGVFLIDFYTTVQQNLLLRVGCGYAERFSAPI
jgi:hypothetical protein